MLTDRSPATFRTADDKVACFFGPATSAVGCQVSDAHWTVPPRPANCQGGYGDEIQLARQHAELVCHTDTAFVGKDSIQPPLGPGHAAIFHALRCAVTTAGVSCRDPQGHGFTVTQRSYRTF